MRRIRNHLTFSNGVALLALFVALGGVTYAATTLPKNSVGPRQIKTGAVRSSEVKNDSLLAQDFKAGELPRGSQGSPGPRGPKGDKGDKGDKGPQGDPGPGAISFNFTDPEHQGFYVFEVVDDIELSGNCTSSGVGWIFDPDNGQGAGVVGTLQANSGAPAAVHQGGSLPAFGPTGTLDMNVISSDNVTKKWVQFNLTAIHHSNGTCSWSGLITPPS